ncbi:cation:proton antiporter [Marinobacter xestospongiae]|uniref:cation:proton antiporter n=1 Tax=Marinobacter xestospongiae TaxID=994319 RepID=UPI0020064182|nr:cation:proton antiporter family protein [Marinobacter xestospongiae]MCK7567238.1 cation:proton antiporter [Marinobacter xestospongiae]
MFDSVFFQIGVIVGLSAVAGAIAQWLRQPLIVAFIAVGILLGPSASGMVLHSSEIELFARLGIALLLFVVGLKLDIHVIRTVGPVALASGLGQVFFTSVVGYLIALLLGMPHVEAIYVAVALTFSSTIIIVKLLSDKREVDSLHGRIAVGFLIVQDIVVVLVMIGLIAYGEAGKDVSISGEALKILLKGSALLITVALLMRYVLPHLLHRLARSSELLMLFAIAWAVLGGVTGELLGFSKEVGAFLAGISIASTPYREQVAARLVSLRDFLLLFFFIELGATLDLSTLGAQLGASVVFSVFVLVGNPIIVMGIMGYMGYRRRTGFLAGLTVAQISEFSLILAALGLSLGHLQQETAGLITLVGLITISASTYMILYSHALYEKLAPWLTWFERDIPHRELENQPRSNTRIDVLLIGLGRYGAALAANLRAHEGCGILAVDFDPSAVQQHMREGYSVHYGDAEDPEFVATLPLTDTRWVVSTIRDLAINKTLLHGLERQHYTGKVAIACSNHRDAEKLEQAGVDLVLIPYSDAAREAAEQIMHHGCDDNTGGDRP